MTTWHLLTGEFPPQPGGVSDYTMQVAEGLTGRGASVHVWAPGEPIDPGRPYPVHRLRHGFGPRGLAQIAGALSATRPSRLLVQYVPHAFGFRGMNLLLTAWLRRRREPVWVMFHEVAFPVVRGQPLRHRVLALAQRRMAAQLACRAERVLVSTPAWRPLLDELAGRRIEAALMPIPSNLPTSADPERVRAIRVAQGSTGPLLGHFGTYGELIRQLLDPIAQRVLGADPRRRLLLLGRGGHEFAASLRARAPAIASQLVATGELPAEEVAAHLCACDLLVQPFPDGATTRRSTLAAAIALGCAVVTNRGPLTESIWEGAVALADAPDATQIAALVERMLVDPGRHALAQRARELYAARFSLAHTLDGLQLDSRDP